MCISIRCLRPLPPTFSLTSALPTQDLPSFPTRRSSDLSCCAARCVTSRSRRSHPLPRSSTARSASRTSSCKNRSEEHTSELQSRGHLVCRLLLEKKKKQISINRVDKSTYNVFNISRTDP